MTDPLITEVSGIAASRAHTDILYVHNDSGDGPYIYAIHALTGEVKSKITINMAIHNDWEDIAYGVCHDQEYCLFIGNDKYIGTREHNYLINIIYINCPYYTEVQYQYTISFEENIINCNTF